MAPSTKGTNPAPNYTVAMNQVQTQIEAQLRIVRSFMPSRAPPPNAQTATTKPTPSFSALATSTSKPSLLPRQRAPKQDAESLFAETRAQDPNAGLGFGQSSKRAAEREKERENQILRSRLLGRKRGAAPDASGRTRHHGESSDEEPGRSGLGRAKKRARREESREEGEEGIGPELELEKAGAKQVGEDSAANDEEETGDVNMKTGVSDPAPDGAEGAPAEGAKKRKRKKKNKKRKKEKSEEATAE
ncbi:hypothetical protein F5B22DRAFT_59505 [Xylaria bambusicola]|uniref:uncharacterized protein n=1 Tax=Xylaria bambusicola TaxID=326684 RepID=UPI002008403D|nr:uncharacterized protein F5B22DRAFT_59505 [Xylaria bambusicola]KAI0518388.1 hypothetical protein F5B22DRAFT_59505 [Xylaria bambusicola]